MATGNLTVKLELDPSPFVADLRALSRAFNECADRIEIQSKGLGEPGICIWINGDVGDAEALAEALVGKLRTAGVKI